MADDFQARVRNCADYYRIKYGNKEDAIAAAKARFLELYEAAEGEDGRTLTSFGADGQNAGWQAGLSLDQRIDALRQVIAMWEGRTAKVQRISLGGC